MAKSCKHGTRADGVGCLKCAAEYGVSLAEQIRTFPQRRDEFKEKLKSWVASPEGRKALEEALEAAATEAARLNRVQRMKPEDWSFRVDF